MADKKPAKKDENYWAANIQVLEWLEPVRKRPWMYIGSTDERWLHHRVWEIVDNSIDEAIAGHCDTITVTLHEDGACSVQDNGRWIPTGIHPKTNIIDERSGEKYRFYFEWGIRSYVNFLNKNERTLGEVFYAEKEKNDILVELSFQYNREYSNNIISFVNNIHTPEGGSHMTGFRTALTRTINKYARDKGILKEKDQNLTNDDVIEGLTAVISIKVIDPQFEWQTKSKLGTPEARWAVDSVFSEKLMEFLEENPRTAKSIYSWVRFCRRFSKTRSW